MGGRRVRRDHPPAAPLRGAAPRLRQGGRARETIADIYDALTASDRPYKKAIPPEKALDILADEARRGQIDPPLLDVFVEAGVWRATARAP